MDRGERFDTPERLQDWLLKRSLVPAATQLSRTDLDIVRALRTALRTILGPGDDQVRQHQLEVLNGIVRQVPLVLQFDDAGRPRLAPGGSGVQGGDRAYTRDHCHGPGGGVVAADEALPQRGMPAGLLRQLEKSFGGLVLFATLWQPHGRPCLPRSREQ